MKKLASTVAGLACAGGMVMGSGAVLADGVDRAPKRAAPPPVVAPVYTWGGLYVGAHLGGAWSDLDRHVLNSPFDFKAFEHIEDLDGSFKSLEDGRRHSHDLSSFIGGGQIGIQHQWGRWVFGVEASLSGGQDLEDKTTNFPTRKFEFEEAQFKEVFDDLDAEDVKGRHRVSFLRTEMDWLILGVARLGYTWDRWMLYGKGGYAQAKIKLAGERRLSAKGDWETGQEGGPEGEFELSQLDRHDSSERHHGWTIGAGVEYLLMPNVVLGLEYNYIDLESKRHDGVTRVNTKVCLEGDYEKCESESALRRHSIDVDPDAIHTVWARLSFKLNREVPVEPLK